MCWGSMTSLVEKSTQFTTLAKSLPTASMNVGSSSSVNGDAMIFLFLLPSVNVGSSQLVNVGVVISFPYTFSERW